MDMGTVEPPLMDTPFNEQPLYKNIELWSQSVHYIMEVTMYHIIATSHL